MLSPRPSPLTWVPRSPFSSHLLGEFRYGISSSALASTGDQLIWLPPKDTWSRFHFTHLCLGRRPLPLGSYREHRRQKAPVLPNLSCSQRHSPGKIVPCTPRGIHNAQPRVLGLQRQGGQKSGSRCRCTRCLQQRAEIRSSKVEHHNWEWCLAQASGPGTLRGRGGRILANSRPEPGLPL